jgi:predicted type IV restriction endonuclease
MIENEIRELSKRIQSMRKKGLNEANTKQRLILPFLRLLKYDPSEYLEVEYNCIKGINREPVDYALLQHDKPIIIIECKPVSNNNLAAEIPQLTKYYNSKSSIVLGILTNGIEYLFFTDNCDTNVMDEEPFLIYNITKHQEGFDFIRLLVLDDNFDLDRIHVEAKKIWETNKISIIVHEMLSDPPDDIIKIIMKKFNPKFKATKRNLDSYKEIIISKLNVSNQYSAREQQITSPSPPPGLIEVFFKARGVTAKGLFNHRTNKIIVKKGSEFSKDVVHSYGKSSIRIREEMIRNKTLKLRSGNKYILTSDIEFNSPSTAGSLIAGRSINGWDKWKVNDGKTIKELIRGNDGKKN